MCLNHPVTVPHSWSLEKLSSTKLVPGAKKVGDCWSFEMIMWFVFPFANMVYRFDLHMLNHPGNSGMNIF